MLRVPPRSTSVHGALALLLISVPAFAQKAPPVVPGLARNHLLDEEQVGRVLLQELRCTACHEADGSTAPPAPDLSRVGERADPVYLRRFLADPEGAQPGTCMPDLLGSEADRERTVEALVHFLVARGEGSFSGEALVEANPEVGRRLFHSIGCVACHAPREGAEAGERAAHVPGSSSLDHVAAKYGPHSLATFLFQPLEARPAGRMPDLGLTRGESRDIAAYLAQGRGSSPGLVPAAEMVEEGRAHYERLGCARCHELQGVESRSAGVLAELDPEGGCLDPADTVTPRFGLSATQRSALRAALGARRTPGDRAAIAETLTALDCIACHQRGEAGGIPPQLLAYFRTSEPELGDEARIPPPLHETGAKLRDTWLREVLYEGARVRPYMQTRMPRFGALALGDLPEQLLRADRIEPYELEPPAQGEETKELREGGRELLGYTGLACIACHTFNGKPSPGFQGVDLISSYERLQPDWFARFLIDPQRYRPGIVMPESWPGGQAAHGKILGGETKRQLEGLWYFLSLGTSARDPEGIARIPTRLEVTDEVRTYRGRSRVAGFRGIAVGFPGGLNYAFDARTGALAALWKGGFVSVNWSGQGAGDFQPSARAIELGHDLSLYRLTSESEPWPLSPFMDEENPVDPDPDYPRNRGYRFGGYALDEQRVPTFEYRSGTVHVLDRSAPVEGTDGVVLRRELTLTSSAPENLWLRVATGDLRETGVGTFEIEGLRVVLPDRPHRLRTLRSPGLEGERVLSELLLRIELSAGETRLAIDHVLLP